MKTFEKLRKLIDEYKLNETTDAESYNLAADALARALRGATLEASREKRYIVWNEDRTEGFITDDEQDAMQALSGGFFSPYSALGERFHELYGEDDIGLEEITIDASPEDGYELSVFSTQSI